MTRLTHCPTCGARVHRTHRCTARPATLTPMPPTFRQQLEHARAQASTSGTVPLPPFTDEGEG